MDLPIYELTINPAEENKYEVTAVAFVDAPAIERDFIAFNAQNFVNPEKGEHEAEFIPRCISYVVGEGKDQQQAAGICYGIWEQHFAGAKVSFDYDDTLSTDQGKQIAKAAIADGNTVYIISARQDKEGMLSTAKDLGIPESRVYATGSNAAKIEKIKALGISKHYDNNQDVINAIGSTGQKFAFLGFAIQNEECREVFGAAMIPDMLIYRNDGMGEYYVKFSADTIKQIAEKFFTKDYHKSANIMHESGTPLDGVVFFQSLIKDSTKGITLAGDHPDGTWFLGAKINNDALWQGIKTGKYKGFSVEGLFAGKPTDAAQMQYQKIMDIINGTDL